jgi:hypothetical protein
MLQPGHLDMDILLSENDPEPQLLQSSQCQPPTFV